MSFFYNNSTIMQLFSETYVFCTNHKYIYQVILIGAWFLLGVFIYKALYKILKLKGNLYSSIKFLLFYAIILCYLYGFKYIFSNENINPIYIENLPLLSNYRYIILSIIVVILSLLWALSFVSLSVSHLFSNLMYPYIKEEIRQILYVWNDTFMGDLCIFLYNRIVNSHIFCLAFFYIHFFLFYFLKAVTVCFLINFAFFHGDLRLFLYTLPLLFFIWLLSFFDYYFKIFREGTKTYLCEILTVNYKGLLTSLDIKNGFLETHLKDLKFSLTSTGLNEGFTYSDLDHLKRKWISSANITLKFKNYYETIYIFSGIIVALMCFCWFAISYYFLTKNNSGIIENTFYFSALFRRFPLHSSASQIQRIPREARYIKEGKPMNDIKEATKGAVSPGHPVVGEVEGSQFRIDGGLTHGKSSPPNLSVPLSETGIHPDLKPVNLVPLPEGSIKVPLELLKDHPIANSQDFCEKPAIKEKLDSFSKGKTTALDTTESDLL